jgi:hypothetical protein
VSSLREVKNGHLKLELMLGDRRRLGCFAPRRGELARTLQGHVRVVGDLRLNSFGGVDSAELFVDEVSPLERGGEAPALVSSPTVVQL